MQLTKSRTILVLTMVVALTAVMFVAPAVANDPDAPPSGDACGTSQEFTPAGAAGTVGGSGDPVDVYKSPFDEDIQIGFHTAFRANEYHWEIYNADCEKTDFGVCQRVINHACYGGSPVTTASDISHGQVPGQHATVPAGGYVVIQPRSAYDPVDSTPQTHYSFNPSPDVPHWPVG